MRGLRFEIGGSYSESIACVTEIQRVTAIYTHVQCVVARALRARRMLFERLSSRRRSTHRHPLAAARGRWAGVRRPRFTVRRGGCTFGPCSRVRTVTALAQGTLCNTCEDAIAGRVST